MLIIRPLATDDDAHPFKHVFELVEIQADGHERAPVTDVLDGLAPDKQALMYARFHKLDAQGFFSLAMWHQVGEWFKHIGSCWEVGDDVRVRFYGFRERDKIVLVTGCTKRGKKTPKEQTDWCAQQEHRYKAQGR